MKAIEQYFILLMFVLLYKVVPTLETVDGIPKCANSKSIEQYFPVVLFIMLYKVVVHFRVGEEIFISVAIQMKAKKNFPVVLFIMFYKVLLTFEYLDESVTTEMEAVEQYGDMQYGFLCCLRWFSG